MKKRTLFLFVAILACLVCVALTVITASSPTFQATATARAAARATKAAPTHTVTPTITPTSTPAPTPIPTPVRVELGEAEVQGLVRVEVSGEGLESIRVLLESLSSVPLAVSISPGTVFEAQSAGTQNMVAREKREAYLKAGGSSRVTVPVACANMELGVPEDSDRFTIGRAPVPEDLKKLLGLAGFQDESFRVQQFAIWTITDNPARDSYVGLGRFGFGSGPEEDEIQRIRELFERAGISIADYQALH